MKRLFLLPVLALPVCGCANPLNAVTAERYSTECRQAESNNQLRVAEEACSRALWNVQVGNLGPEEESVALLNLGLIKRRLGAHSDAETMFKESLRLQESLRTPDQHLIGVSLFQLAQVLADQGKTADAWPSLSRLAAMSDSAYGDQDQQRMVRDAFIRFAEVYDQIQMTSEAEVLRKRAGAP